MESKAARKVPLISFSLILISVTLLLPVLLASRGPRRGRLQHQSHLTACTLNSQFCAVAERYGLGVLLVLNAAPEYGQRNSHLFRRTLAEAVAFHRRGKLDRRH